MQRSQDARTVLHITNDFTDEVGGISRHVDELTKHQAQRAKVVIAYLTRQRSDQVYEDEFGRLVHLISHKGSSLVRLFSPLTARLNATIESCEPDLIHVHTPIEALQFTSPGRIPSVYTQHSSVLDRWLEVPGLRQAVLARLDSFSEVIAVSESVANKLKPIRTVVIPNGVNENWPFNSSEQRAAARGALLNKHGIADPGGLLLLFLGRLVKNKGLEPFLLANKSLLSGNHGRMTFVVVGDGNQLSRLTNLVSRESLTCVHLVGKVDPGEVTNYYGAADLCIIPSIREPFGMVALEAMASGALSIINPIGGLVDIVQDGKNGYHLGPSLSLLPVLAKLSNETQKELRQRAIDTVCERYLWSSVAERTWARYEPLFSS